MKRHMLMILLLILLSVRYLISNSTSSKTIFVQDLTMSEAKEQVKPLAPAALRVHIEEQEHAATSADFLASSHRNCIKCCGCSAAIFLIAATIVIVLMFTVFHVKDPILKMNSVKIQGLDVLVNSKSVDHPNVNLTIEADVSIKNPNVASFRFSNTTTDVCYDGKIVGESRSPPGEARAGRTLRMNVTIDLMIDKIRRVERLKSDLDRGILPISSNTTISGKVKITNAIKRSVEVRMNCTMNVNVSSAGIQDRDCRRKVSL